MATSLADRNRTGQTIENQGQSAPSQVKVSLQRKAAVPACFRKSHRVEEMKRLVPREGLKKCFDGLREAGWDVYGVTNGGKETSLNYYKLAGIDLDAEHLLSCDELKIAKPDLRVYANTNKVLDQRVGGKEGDGERFPSSR